ncbi:MAG: nucleoside-diphosphate kinase [bacterium]
MEETFVIIKPDAVEKQVIGEVLSFFERDGLRIMELKMLKLDRIQGEELYSVHRDKPFYSDLVEFIKSGPIVACILEGEGAIERVRELIGATDPKKAQAGTIRAKFGTNIQVNAVHASDSPESYKREAPIVFGDLK